MLTTSRLVVQPLPSFDIPFNNIDCVSCCPSLFGMLNRKKPKINMVTLTI
uniref:Uncharacterized protein n=1 Tax=Lepeophtheirus salmonis TaxID=72036 RepID=A0A0K2U6Q6_LEPSM